ncbi:MAG: hypothetical protein HOD54_00975 [Candidatus Magasanikbacteria bacterium]|jgi:hypothetical protein|nr:hypothetical protein [Candidatus Magasanikbacteria bacterium]MBT4314645.1 hypothetical protein [Candidatus Magasanikbacteria bacterium]
MGWFWKWTQDGLTEFFTGIFTTKEGIITLVITATGIAIAAGLSYASLQLVLSLIPKDPKGDQK